VDKLGVGFMVPTVWSTVVSAVLEAYVPDTAENFVFPTVICEVELPSSQSAPWTTSVPDVVPVFCSTTVCSVLMEPDVSEP